MSGSYRRIIPITYIDDTPESARRDKEEEPPTRDPKDAKIEKLELELVFVRERDTLYRELKEHQAKVDSEIKKNARNFGLGSLIFVIIALVGIIGSSITIYQFTSQLVLYRLDTEFREPNIQRLIQQAAETRAADIIDKKVEPVVKQAQQTIAGLEMQLRKDVEAIRAEYRQEIEDLKQEVSYQKKVREIQQFQNAALIDGGDFGAFEALKKYLDADDNLKQVAKGALFWIEGAYTLTRSSVEEIWVDSPEGKIANEKLSTTTLLNGLHSSPDWRVRAKVAGLLRDRQECNVPEQLLKTINSDQKLRVRREALISFGIVTKGNLQRPLGFEQAQEWYEQHRDDVRLRLKCDPAMPPYPNERP